MGWTPRPLVEPGDRILTPYGVAVVTALDAPRDGIVTTKGNWAYEELEELDVPNLEDIAEVESWLSVVARIVPSTRVETSTRPCLDECKCAHCYRVEHFRPDADGNSVLVDGYHFRNNDVCACERGGCKCC